MQDNVLLQVVYKEVIEHYHITLVMWCVKIPCQGMLGILHIMTTEWKKSSSLQLRVITFEAAQCFKELHFCLRISIALHYLLTCFFGWMLILYVITKVCTLELGIITQPYASKKKKKKRCCFLLFHHWAQGHCHKLHDITQLFILPQRARWLNFTISHCSQFTTGLSDTCHLFYMLCAKSFED